MTVGVWTVVVAEGRGSGRGPWVAVSGTSAVLSRFIDCGWAAAAGNGLLEMPIPLRINRSMSL
jgi:hypothetical protein